MQGKITINYIRRLEFSPLNVSDLGYYFIIQILTKKKPDEDLFCADSTVLLAHV